jgi:hypothetical protein
MRVAYSPTSRSSSPTTAPLVAGLSGVGPRVEEPGIGVIPGYAFSAPYEEVKLKVR